MSYRSFFIEADRGGGKTLLMVRLTTKIGFNFYRLSQEPTIIYSNFKFLNLAEEIYDCRYLGRWGFYAMPFLNNCVSAFDEIDKCFPAMEENKLFKKAYIDVLKNARKRNHVSFYNTQHRMFMDITIRRFTSDIIRCRSFQTKKSFNVEALFYRYHSQQRGREELIASKTFYHNEKFFSKFDTNEEIEQWLIPTDLLKPKLKKERMKNEEMIIEEAKAISYYEKLFNVDIEPLKIFNVG